MSDRKSTKGRGMKQAKIVEDVKEYLRKNRDILATWPPDGQHVARSMRLDVARNIKRAGVVAWAINDLDVPISRCVRELREEDRNRIRHMQEFEEARSGDFVS
jgi:hypothetical protein